MLASVFILQGYETLRHPEAVAQMAEPVVRALSERISFVPAGAEQSVRLNGAVHLVAGSLLALGHWPRLSALALAATLVPTTWAAHRFWATDNEQERAQAKIHFLKNVSLTGGLLIAAADTAGEPSLAWKGRNAVRCARRDAVLAARTARRTARPAAAAGRLSAKRSRAR